MAGLVYGVEIDRDGCWLTNTDESWRGGYGRCAEIPVDVSNSDYVLKLCNAAAYCRDTCVEEADFETWMRAEECLQRADNRMIECKHRV